MPDQFVYEVSKVEIGDDEVKLEFGEGKNGMISMTVRKFMDILRKEFPGEVFEKIEMHMAVTTEVPGQARQVGYLVTNRATIVILIIERYSGLYIFSTSPFLFAQLFLLCYKSVHGNS